MLTRRELFRTAALATLAVPAWKSPALAQTTYFGFLATKRIAEAGFIYGLPLVVNYADMYEQAIDRRSGQFKAPFNQIKHDGRVWTHKDKAEDFPSVDTARSMVWMDLRAEPVVLSVPAIDPQRYYAVMLRDGSNAIYGYIGSRATGNEAGDYLVAGPDWDGETPSNIKRVFRSSTQFSIALYRTRLFNPDDIGNVRKVQAGYKVATLSSHLKQSPPPVRIVKFLKIRKKLLRKNFFQNLAFAMQFAPVQPLETDARANIAKIGVGPGRTFNFSDLTLKNQLAMTLGIRAGDRKIDRALAEAHVVMNGWRVPALFGDGDFYGEDWLLRAAAAKSGIHGDDPLEAVGLSTRVDAEGKTLDAGRHDYTLTFAAGELPPVHAFWSLTLYDGDNRYLVKNPINRYVIDSSMLPTMKTDANGALTIYIQHKSPAASEKANWLPAPNGPMSLKLRLYWPKIETPSILPIGKATWHPPGLARVS